MRLIIILLIFLYGWQLSYNQELISDDSIILKAGIYKSFNEFKFNNPSLTFPPNFFRSNDSVHNEAFFTYRLRMNKQALKAVGHVFGFCDGKNIFCNVSEPRLESQTPFQKIEFVGRYCFFRDKIHDGTVNGRIGSYVIDINTGESFFLNKDSVKNILKTDGKLLNEFEMELKKSKNLKKYIIDGFMGDKHTSEIFREFIIKYSEKNKNTINNQRGRMGVDELEEFIKQQSSDTTYMIYYNRILKEIKSYSTFWEVTLWEEKYSNGQHRSIGISARHDYDENPNLPYRIGLWRYFNKNGTLKEEVMYNLFAEKTYTQKYDDSGKLISKEK